MRILYFNHVKFKSVHTDVFLIVFFLNAKKRETIAFSKYNISLYLLKTLSSLLRYVTIYALCKKTRQIFHSWLLKADI